MVMESSTASHTRHALPGGCAEPGLRARSPRPGLFTWGHPTSFHRGLTSLPAEVIAPHSVRPPPSTRVCTGALGTLFCSDLFTQLLLPLASRLPLAHKQLM